MTQTARQRSPEIAKPTESAKSYRNLEERLRDFESPVEMLRNSQTGPYVFPVPGEFSNWRDEQEAWRKTAVLLDQSYHMTDLYIEGRDTIRLLTRLGVNSFENFVPNKAKQFVACNDDGFVIGDVILFFLDENRVSLVGRPPLSNWVEFHARTGGYDVAVERDERSLANPKPRKTYRFQVQGPNADEVLKQANGGTLPHIKFFNMGELTIAGRKVRALRHGMSGAPGLELWGPVQEGAEVKAAILKAGREFGLRQGGARAYSTVAIESGWLPSPMPAIYSGEKMKSYREWLPADGFEGTASLGGSFYSRNIEDYYLTPWDIGYGSIVKFDHDFIGRAALEKLAGEPHRKKVTLSWNSDDVTRVFASMFSKQDRAKYMDMPASHYATLPYDAVLQDGKIVGVSTYPVYTANARAWISLAMVDRALSEPGAEVTVLWGEEGGGSQKPTVERHVQVSVRATVGPCPFADAARQDYRPYALQL
ncbi:MAG: aminomethyltransferase family protein [Bradyrhizobiaceae bacterium]|nr:aminomethyltransferase family protein [Bradyrhizobiaceae bacterium]